MPVIKMSNENLDAVIPSTGSCIVDYYADWCGPCKAVAPILDNIGSDDKVTIIKVDIDKFPALAKAANVASIPTLHIYKNGKMVESLRGAQPASVLMAKI